MSLHGHLSGNLRQFPAEGHRRRCDDLPAAFAWVDVVAAFPRLAGAGLATGVSELDAGDGPVLLEEAGDPSERLHMVIEVDAAVGGADAAFRRNGRGLDHHQASAAHGTRAEMHEMPIVREAVVRRILAHRRDGDAVAQHDILQPKLVEQARHFIAPVACPFADARGQFVGDFSEMPPEVEYSLTDYGKTLRPITEANRIPYLEADVGRWRPPRRPKAAIRWRSATTRPSCSSAPATTTAAGSPNPLQLRRRQDGTVVAGVVEGAGPGAGRQQRRPDGGCRPSTP